MAAYRPLVLLTQDLRLATLVIRHARKGDHEDVTDTARGSNAASGEADIILSLARPQGRQGEGRSIRTLRGVGRLAGIPEELNIEIVDRVYIALPDGSEVQATRHRHLVERFLATHPDSTYDEITAGTGITRTSVISALADLTLPSTGTVDRHGRGVRNGPLRFRVRPIDVANPSARAIGDDPDSGFPTEPSNPPTPASHGPFSTPFRAHQPADHEGFATASAFPSQIPSERPTIGWRGRGPDVPPVPSVPVATGQIALDIDVDAPDLVALARAVFGDEIALEQTVSVPLDAFVAATGAWH